jgi:sulfite exporter TauE/SafE
MNSNTVFQRLFLLLVLTIAGCVVAEKSKYTTSRELANKLTMNTGKSLDWLTIIGAVTIAFGVAGYLSGNTKAINIIAAGATLTALGLLISSFLCVFTEYRTQVFIVLCVLGIVAFFTFARSIADFNHDGKIDWQDLKAMFLKIKNKT